jgi:mRNA interferase RelE/StbE
MKLDITKKFQKDLKKIDLSIKPKILNIIDNIENADNLNQINDVKKIKGYKNYYRIKIGNYRLGFRLFDDEVKLERLMHRKEIYKYFP